MFLSCVDGIWCWVLILLLYGKAAGHLLSILSFFFRRILLLFSSFLGFVHSGLQASFPCSPSHFHWWLLVSSPFGGAAFPHFPCFLTLEFFELHSLSLWKKLPTFCFPFLFGYSQFYLFCLSLEERRRSSRDGY